MKISKSGFVQHKGENPIIRSFWGMWLAFAIAIFGGAALITVIF